MTTHWLLKNKVNNKYNKCLKGLALSKTFYLEGVYMARRKAEKKTSSITRFSFKSSFIVMFGILASTLGFPLLLDAFGLQLNFLRVIVIGVTSGGVIAYCLYFVDSNKGMRKGFWIVFGLIAILSMFISYYWIFNIYPI